MFAFKITSLVAVLGFSHVALAQGVPACLLAVVNQVDNPSNLTAVCGSNIATQIANVCHGVQAAAASSAFSSVCSGVSSAVSSVVQGSTAGATSAPTSVSSTLTPFSLHPSTPISTGGMTTIAGTPTYAPVGPVAFNTAQAPTEAAASYVYQPATTPLGNVPVATPTPTPTVAYVGAASKSDNNLAVAAAAALGAVILL